MDRLIRLRRPPVVRLAEEPFVPRVDLAEVQRRWAALQAANSAFFDGRMLHVFGVVRNGHGGATLHVAECAYRHWAVGLAGHGVPSERGVESGPNAGPNADLNAGYDTGVRALGVKAIVLAGDCALLGQRSDRVAAYPGCWEFAPGGGVEPGRDPRDMIVVELGEETGLSLEPGDRVTARAVLFDDSVRSWEIVYVIRLREPRALLAASDEYRSLRWVEVSSLKGQTTSGRAAPAGIGAASLTSCARAMLELLPRGEGLGARAERERRDASRAI